MLSAILALILGSKMSCTNFVGKKCSNNWRRDGASPFENVILAQICVPPVGCQLPIPECLHTSNWILLHRHLTLVYSPAKAHCHHQSLQKGSGAAQVSKGPQCLKFQPPVMQHCSLQICLHWLFSSLSLKIFRRAFLFNVCHPSYYAMKVNVSIIVFVALMMENDVQLLSCETLSFIPNALWQVVGGVKVLLQDKNLHPFAKCFLAAWHGNFTRTHWYCCFQYCFQELMIMIVITRH